MHLFAAGLTLHLDNLHIYNRAALASGPEYTGNVLVAPSARVGSGCLIGEQGSGSMQHRGAVEPQLEASVPPLNARGVLWWVVYHKGCDWAPARVLFCWPAGCKSAADIPTCAGWV